MVYIEYKFIIHPIQPGRDILLAELGELPFESFEDFDMGLLAYIDESEDSQTLIEDIHILNSGEFEISYVKSKIEQVNWNEEWEKNFHPIHIDNRLTIRAPFHAKTNADIDIIIEPKMSFGTGHHATTYQISEMLLDEDCENKIVLDMGCGTGVLGILADIRGAKSVDYIDIDTWCVENTEENLERNFCQGHVILGGAEKIEKDYDLILANINRNILLEDMTTYARHLVSGGVIYFSGFYEEDLRLIQKEANRQNLTFVKHQAKENWVAAKFTKN
ncbi:50S ribosomal protein L11 methyltransferase [Psychroflexus montanilacus]|uniref:50S ribosomal protein L11 methyltransferase n=1 Tax=Psychroflexus montanilacus TaxID=2873598 RepID=UPI001CCB4EF0|nr:50S ribosomal protein L11 methyltransferase [Psychroflexus montanilacus]MBZ9653098.1 50S ribosomal protein L11 methyltransferase [Psychroflexus montanilacus]